MQQHRQQHHCWCHTTSPAAGQTQAIVSAHAAALLPKNAPNRHTITAINTMQTQPCLHRLPPTADSFASVVPGACAAPVGGAHHRAGCRPASPLVDCLVVCLDRVNDLAVLPALRGKVNAKSVPRAYSKHQAAATSIQELVTALAMSFTFCFFAEIQPGPWAPCSEAVRDAKQLTVVTTRVVPVISSLCLSFVKHPHNLAYLHSTHTACRGCTCCGPSAKWRSCHTGSACRA